MLLKGAKKMKTLKKNLSLVLALLLMTATFAVAASAVETAQETPVGTADKGLTDTEFTDKSSNGQTISVKVNEVEHRYAVDLTFSFDDLTIDSTIVWNVKDMKYDVSDTTLTNQDRTIAVTNRSDMPIYAYADVRDEDVADGVTISSDATADSRLTVGKATVGAGNTAGTSTTENIKVSLNSDSWQKVAEYYAAKKVEAADNNSKFTLTTVTVTISKSSAN